MLCLRVVHRSMPRNERQIGLESTYHHSKGSIGAKRGGIGQ